MEVGTADRWLLGLLAWTAFVWGNRIANALEADEGAGALVLSALVLAAAVVTALGVRRSISGADGPHVDRARRALPALTVPVWVVRGADIALSGHEAAFVAVHLALAAISVALAVAAWRALGPATWSATATAR